MTRWSEQDLANHLERTGVPAKHVPADTSVPPFLTPDTAQAYAKATLAKRKQNKTEAAYDAYLARQLAAGEILYYKFEPTGLRLADNTFYHPDFGVMTKDSFYEFHEVKGFMREDANVKIKVAAKLHPFRFIVVYKDGNGWRRVEVPR